MDLSVKVRSAGNLAAQLAERLSAEIRSGRLREGDQLPTEQALIDASGVSRAVVREAISALRADGLVVTQQGRGAFVAAGARLRPFRIDPAGLGSLQSVLDVLELRMSVELESAAIAAERRTPAQLDVIEAALIAIDEILDRGEVAATADFNLHCAIAVATGNTYFSDFMLFMGSLVIPRQTVQVSFRGVDQRAEYLRMVQNEHRRIVEAIRKQLPDEARHAMRVHLVDGRERYRRLQEEHG